MKFATFFGALMLSSFVVAQDVRMTTTSLGISREIGSSNWGLLDGLGAYYRGNIDLTEWYFTLLKDGIRNDCDEMILGFRWNDTRWRSCLIPSDKPLRRERQNRDSRFRIKSIEDLQGNYSKIALEIGVLELGKESTSNETNSHNIVRELISTQHTFHGLVSPNGNNGTISSLFEGVRIRHCDNQIAPTEYLSTTSGDENRAYMNCDAQSKHYAVGPIRIVSAYIDYTPEDTRPDRKCTLTIATLDTDHVANKVTHLTHSGHVTCTCTWSCGSDVQTTSKESNCDCKGYRQDESSWSYVLDGASSGKISIEASPISSSGQFTMNLDMKIWYPLGMSTFPQRGLEVEPCNHMEAFNKLNPRENGCQMLEKTGILRLTRRDFEVDKFRPIRNYDKFTRRFTLKKAGTNFSIADMCPGGGSCDSRNTLYKQ